MGGGSKSVKTKVERYIPPPTPQETSLLRSLINLGTTNYYRPSSEFVQVMRNPYLSMLPYREKIGETLNALAARGVINSTITQNALDKASRWMAERALEAKTQTLAMLEEARRASSADKYNRLYRLWHTLYAGRMGVPTTVTTQKGGPSPLTTALGQAAGFGLGYWLGPGGGFNKVASWGRDVLGSVILPFVPGSFV